MLRGSVCLPSSTPLRPKFVRYSHRLQQISNAIAGVTNNVITSQVASGLVAGLFPLSEPHDVAVMIQSSNFDSLEPTYSCGAASRLISDYTTGSDGAHWQAHLTEAASLYAKLDKVSGIATQDSGGWHVSFDQYVAFRFFDN